MGLFEDAQRQKAERDAAQWNAAASAAEAAARASARAARDAEHAWQTRHLHAVLTGTRKPGTTPSEPSENSAGNRNACKDASVAWPRKY